MVTIPLDQPVQGENSCGKPPSIESGGSLKHLSDARFHEHSVQVRDSLAGPSYSFATMFFWIGRPDLAMAM